MTGLELLGGGAAEIAAGDGVTVQNVGGVMQIAVDSSVLRDTEIDPSILVGKTVGQWYMSSMGQPSTAPTLTEDRALYIPRILKAGTIDRMAIDVTAFTAGATVRLGLHASEGDKPDPTSGLLGECTDLGAGDGYPLNAGASNGIKTAQAAIVVPTDGLYWFVFCPQNAGTGVPGVRHALSGPFPLPLGTTAPAATASYQGVRHVSGVTGALPASPTISETSLDTANPLIRFRYSA